MSSQFLSPYIPPRMLGNAHLQNLLSSFGLRKLLLKQRHKTWLQSQQQLILETPQGVRLLAELNQHAQTSRSVVILIHGWEGSGQSAYLLSMAAHLFHAGYDTLRLHLRDHGNTTHLNKEIFNSSMIDEIVDAISEFQKLFEYDIYNLAGFSLGGNFVLRCGLYMESMYRPLTRIMAVCPVLDPANTMVAMQNTFSFYDRYFVRKWKRSLREKSKHFSDYQYRDELKGMRMLDEMNRYFIPRYTPFDTLEDYFDSYTLTGDRLSKLEVPTLIVASKDDPIIPADDYRKVELNRNTRLEITLQGGHCAYLENWRLESWLDKRAAHFFR